MPFQPPRCPFLECTSSKPGEQFPWRRSGSFRRRCDGRRVQRFLCLTCKRRFSTQSFTLDYRLQKPGINILALDLFASKVTHRQTARILGVSRGTVERRLRLFGAHCELFHRARVEGKALDGVFQLDELETFETDRRLMPVTMPVLIERDSRYMLHFETAPLPARGGLSPALEAKKQKLEQARGKRVSGSREAVKKCFEVLAEHRTPERRLVIHTDLKGTYPGILADVFAKDSFTHATTHSGKKRDTKNPLFAINHTLAMLRDGVSRLVRRTWGHAKLRERLALHGWIYLAWRNYIRGITNKRWEETPAMVIGVEREKWTRRDLLRWSARFPLLLSRQ